MKTSTRCAAALALALLSGCSALPEARLLPPAGLAQAEPIALPRQAGRSGQFALPAALGGGEVQFERQADRWSAFGLLQGDRAALRLRWHAPSGASETWQCRLRRTELTPGIVQAPLGTPSLRCEGPEGAELVLQESVRSTAREQHGHYQRGVLRVELRSEHRLQGSPLRLPDAGGYALLRQGEALAQLDLLGDRPQLRTALPPAPALQAALRDLTLLLGLAWDPARQ